MLRIVLCAFLLQYALLISASGLYSVVGPGTIRSNSKYNVAVSVLKAEGPSQIKVSLNGPSFNETKEIEVLPSATQNVEFEVPKLASGDYNLTAEGVSGVVFRNTTKLNHADEKPSVFVQTDKATYKPADLVQFRVLFLDENTRPARIEGPISVVITDGAQNRIKQISNVNLTKGVYTGELQLSEQPVLGTWKLAINVDGETRETKSFEVDKYVLPKFEVQIDTAKDVVAADNVIKATIRAKYTYGKPVKGKATVSLEAVYGWASTTKQEKTIDVDGKGHVEFSLQGVTGSSYLPPYKLFAVVTEELTGNKQNASATVNLHQQRYKLQSVDSPSTFKPNKSFTYQVAVKNVDGSPVLGSTKKVTLAFDEPNRYFGFVSQSPSIIPQITFEEPLNENGIATFQVTLLTNSSNYYRVVASFDNSQEHLGTISKFQESENREPLRIKVNTKKPRLGEKVSFNVISTGNIPYFVYTIVARGNIVLSDYVVVPENTKKYTVNFTPTFDMVPQATIFIHYVINNDLNFEEKTIDFEKDFTNSIDIVAPVNAKPSEEVKLKVKTDADSFVGLLGVDQSVLLLKSGNDLNKDDIFNSLNKYKTSTPWLRGYGRYPGKTSGVVTLTNANYPYNTDDIYFQPYWLGVPGPMPIAFSLAAPAAGFASSGSFARPGVPGSTGPAQGSGPAPQIRKEFPENWIFYDVENVDNSGFTLTKKIPDTITSWVVTGFSLNPTSGIALTKNPSMIRVFQPFFVSTNLPYSVKRGEVISVPVVVFNYLDKALDVEVTMDNSDREYEFTEATNDVLEKTSDEVQRTKRETVPANSGKSLSFMIRPKNVGTTTLKITATSPLAGDTIHQKLKVEPEGVTQFENRAVFINLKDQPEFSQSLEAEIPQEAVPQSEFIEFSVVGDLLGPTLQNLDNLVRMPYGCGEQNMVNFVPNILVLKYLEVTGRKMPAVETKAKKFLEIGYQRELTYKHDDGSYSAFGKSDRAGSTWLTAYVMRSFHQAGKYTDVDPKVVIAGLDFLVSKQKENGEFPELGKLFDNANQNALALTSFVLLAFFENHELIEKYQSAIGKGVNYVAEEVDKSDDLYPLAIAVVALQLAKHPQADKVLAKLETLARQENDRKWWSKVALTSSGEDGRVIYWKPRSNDVEITSYVLLALLEKEAADKTLPIIKWLIAQRNSNGGFSSTQDTVIGLQALTKFAYKTGSGSGSMDIDFTPAGGTKDTVKVNPENSLVLQTHVLPKNTRKVDFTAKGTGSAMVQLSYRYNLAEKEKKPSFKVTPTVKDSPSPQLLDVDICAEFVPLEEADKEKDSNMAVMEIALPSGFVSDSDTLDGIQTVDRVKRVETKNSDSTVIVYFDSLTPGDVRCLPVKATKAHAVAKQKPASVSLYDYYDTERRATEYYQVASSLCDICQGSDCGEGCKKSA